MNNKSQSAKDHIKNYRKMFIYTNLSIIILIIIPMLVMLAFSYRLYQNNISEMVSSTLISSLQYKKHSLESWLEERKSDLILLSKQKNRLLNEKDFQLLNDMKDSYDCYDKILLLDSNGSTIYSTNNEHYNFQGEDYLVKALRGENGFSSIHLSFVMKQPVFLGYQPIKEGGEVIAVLISQIKLDYISNLTQELMLGETGELYLVGKDKTLLTKSKFIEGGMLRHKIETEAVEKALSGISGVDTYRDYRGVEVFGVYDMIPEMHCVMIMEQDKDEALASFYRFRNGMVPITIIMLIILLLLVFVVSRRTQKYLERQENEIVKHKEQLIYSEKMASVGMMATALTHEINNPLTTIKVLIQSLFAELPENDERKKDLDIILEEIDTINKLSYRFLQYAKPQEPQIKEADINDIIKKVVELLNYQIDKNKLDLKLQLDENLPKIYLDGNQIGQVILNILLNAIQAEPYEGGISVTTYADKDYCNIKITNFNTYLPEELRTRIFEPFFTTKSKGTGLGLAIAKTVLENHNGIIKCESNPTDGTSFIIKLPLKRRER